MLLAANVSKEGYLIVEAELINFLVAYGFFDEYLPVSWLSSELFLWEELWIDSRIQGNIVLAFVDEAKPSAI